MQQMAAVVYPETPIEMLSILGKTFLGNANLVPPCIHWAASLCIRQMEPAILPPARPSPSRGSAEGTANLFGF